MFRLKAREEEGRSHVQQQKLAGSGEAIFARMIVVPALFFPFMDIGALQNHPLVFQE
jgi:hypothetical protein